MRLIDADDFKKFLQALCKAGAPYEDVVQLLDNQPTAYDAERVVEELEKESDFFGGEPMGSLQKAYYCKGVEKAIEIFRKGGVE